MLAEMPSRTLTEWMAYHNLEPFGDELIDLHMAQLEAITVNANRRRGSPAQPKEFRLWKEISTFDPKEFFERLKGHMQTKKD